MPRVDNIVAPTGFGGGGGLKVSFPLFSARVGGLFIFFFFRRALTRKSYQKSSAARTPRSQAKFLYMGITFKSACCGA